VTEWFKVPVLKTGVLKGTVSSNLTASATFKDIYMGPKFFQTIMGRSFFDGQLPRLIKALEKIGCELERFNNSQEKK
jgi:hypothetical protein